MSGTINLSDTQIADKIARQTFQGMGLLQTQLRVNLLEEQKVNTYEKQVIKNFMNIEYGSAASIDQLITAYGYFGSVIDRVKAGGYDVPRDLQTAFDSSEKDLKERIMDNRKARLEGLKRDRDALATAEEKRSKINEEIARLEELVK